MELPDFWRLIDDSKRDLARQIEFIEEHLKSLSDKELLDFDRIIKIDLMSSSNSYKLSFVFGAFDTKVEWTEETFCFYRAWLILQGQECFRKVVENPDELVRLLPFEQCEKFLRLVDDEWKLRHRQPSPVKLLVDKCADEPASLDELNKFVFDEVHVLFPRLIEVLRPLMEMQWHPQDRQLLYGLKQSGADFLEDREIEHVFRCKDSRTAEMLGKELMRLRRRILRHEKELEVHFIEVNSLRALTRGTQQLTELAEQFSAIYDGWGTSI